MRKGRAVRIAGWMVALGCTALCAKTPIVETDLLKIKKVADIDVARDGSVVVYSVLSMHTEPAGAPGSEPNYSYRTNLWMQDLRNPGAPAVELTSGDRTDEAPAISPDGSQLAFVRADAKKRSQVWVMPLKSPGEPHVVTSLEHGATRPQWYGNGKWLLVTSAIPISKLPGKPPFDLERPGRDWWDYDRVSSKADGGAAGKADGSPDGDLHAIRNWLERNAERGNPADLTRIAFLGELALNKEMTFSQLFRIELPAEGSGEGRGTQLTATFRDHTAAQIAPNGETIVFTALPDSPLHPDRLREQAFVWTINENGADEKPLLQKEGFTFRSAQFTPDGKHLVVTGSQNDQPTYRQAMLGVANKDGSGLKWITKDGEPSVNAVDVSQAGYAYYTVSFHGGEPLRRIELKSGKTEDLVAGSAGVNAFGVAGGQLVYAQISAANPNELYWQNAQGSPKQLSRLNAGWLESKQLSVPEEHWLTRPDGTRVQYWVMKPAGVDAGRTYPWVLDMHGGPSAMWGPGEFSMWHEFQLFCSFGYGVVYSNPRGSSGYGYAFQRANYKDWGEGPMGDVMAVVDEAIAKYPAIDRDQLFVTGGSYAGYLTAWIIGHTDRFKAAAALRGVYDLSTFFGEGNAYRLVPDEFGGFPWEPETRKVLDAQSPITYVPAMKTPFLIIHGSADNRTGIVQGQMLFRALKQLNRPVEYIRYPGAGHELTRSGAPLQRMDHMLRIIEFFERYTKDPKTPAAKPEGSSAPTIQ